MVLLVVVQSGIVETWIKTMSMKRMKRLDLHNQ